MSFPPLLLGSLIPISSSAGSCRCSQTLTSRPGTRFGIGCAPHDAHVALPCQTVPSGSPRRYDIVNGNVVVENAPYCAYSWCYVENPEACVDPITGERTAHLSHYDTAGQNMFDLHFSPMLFQYPYVFNADRSVGASLFYSYEVCGNADLYTLPYAKKLENSYMRRFGGGLFYARNSLENSYFEIPVRATMADGRFYPWDDSQTVEAFTKAMYKSNVTHEVYSSLARENFGRTYPLSQLSALRDGADGFFPTYCQSEAARLAAIGRFRDVQNPTVCYAPAGFGTFFGENSWIQTFTRGDVGWWTTVSFLSYGACGQVDTRGPVREKYLPHLLGQTLIESFGNWQQPRSPPSEGHLRELLAKHPRDVRQREVWHVDECASACAGRAACTQWAYFDDGDSVIEAGDVLTVVFDASGAVRIRRADGRVVAFEDEDERNRLWYVIVNNYNRPVGGREVRGMMNGTTEVDVLPKTSIVGWGIPSAAFPLKVRANGKLFYLLDAYASSRCYLFDRHLLTASVSNATASSSTVARHGQLVIEPRRSTPRQGLRAALSAFLKNTASGRWVKDTLFPDEQYFSFAGRRDVMGGDLWLPLTSQQELERIDSPVRIAQSESARTVLRLVLAMRSVKTVQVRTIVPHVVDMLDLSVYSCKDSFVSTGIDECPVSIRKLAFDRFPVNQRVFAWETEAVSDEWTAETAETVLQDKCSETNGALLVRNATDVYIVQKDTEYTDWRLTSRVLEPQSDRLCSHPYITGRVYCGALRTAMQVASSLLEANSIADPDICTVLLRGARCATRPTWHFGGFSLGAPASIVLVAFLDTFLARHYGIDLSLESVTVDIWAVLSFADEEFVASFTERWGDRVNVYVDRHDFTADLFSLYGARALEKVPGHVASAIGSCGVVTKKRVDECYSFCHADALDVQRCLEWATTIFAFNPRAHELVATLMLKQDEIPAEATASKQSETLNTLATAVDFLDNVFLDYLSGERQICFEDMWSHTNLLPVCVSEIDAHPWEYSPYLHHSREAAGRRASWCIAERLRLRARNQTLKDWDALCCNMPDTSHLTLDNMQHSHSFATPSFTGTEGEGVPPPPRPPPSPAAPPSPPKPPTAPPHPRTPPPSLPMPPASPPPPALPPSPDTPPTAPLPPFLPPYPPYPPHIPGTLAPGRTYALRPARMWVPGLRYQTFGFIAYMDDHRITINGGDDISITPGPATTVPMSTVSHVHRLTPTELVVLVTLTDDPLAPAAYHYGVQDGRLIDVYVRYWNADALCSAQAPCALTEMA